MIVNLTIPNNKNLKNGLYVVPTPIGNLGDITIRAIEILKNSDYILCEDTRVSKKLFDKYEIKSKLISYHKFNEKKNLNKIINLLVNKKIISLISDAGTPTISDPGNLLINECVKKILKLFLYQDHHLFLLLFRLVVFQKNSFSMVFFLKKKRNY